MAQPTTLIIGLGNPGDEYVRTRHNIGFMAVDAIAARHHCGGWKKKFKGLIAAADTFLLLKPQTFMNNSGEAAVEAARFYQLPPQRVIVFHDDIDLQPGQVKIKQGGGAGGHNGLKSLDAHIGADYWRVRLGVGRPVTGDPAAKGDAVLHYVLNPFSKADQAWLQPLIAMLADELDLLLADRRGDYLARVPRSAADQEG
jgi:PTH1 family peptidyl-tRNA hydrolase